MMSTHAETLSVAHERTALQHDWATARVLWYRDVVRFFRERFRVVGALAQPLLFWWILGAGLSPTFRLQGADDLGYMQFFFPGVVVMVVLFTAIFATMSVIDDRHAGFLQAVLVAPGSRTAVVLGKCLGSSTVAMLQAALFLLLSPLAGFSLLAIDWGALALALVLTSLALTAIGFSVAWWLDSTHGYHIVMSIGLLPAWVLSGAMFPLPASPWVEVASLVNPMTYAVSAIRRAMHGGVPPVGTVLDGLVGSLELPVMVGFAFAGLCLASLVCHRRR